MTRRIDQRGLCDRCGRGVGTVEPLTVNRPGSSKTDEVMACPPSVRLVLIRRCVALVCFSRQDTIAAGAAALQVLGISSQTGQIAIEDLELHCLGLESTEMLTERTSLVCTVLLMCVMCCRGRHVRLGVGISGFAPQAWWRT